jgi:hypothetical protein
MNNRIDSVLRGIQWFLLAVYCVLAAIMLINNDKKSIITGITLLYIPIFISIIMLINLYGVYQLDWGGKQFDRWTNNWRRFLLMTNKKSRYVLFCKMGALFGVAVSIFIFVMFWDIIIKVIGPYL